MFGFSDFKFNVNQLKPLAHFDALSISASGDSALATWPDFGANGYNAFCDFAPAQPTFKKSVLNGFPVVRFDNPTNDVLIHPVPAGTSNADITMFVVHIRRSVHFYEGIYSLNVAPSTENPLITWRATSNEIGMMDAGVADVGVFVTLPSGTDINNWNITVARRAGGTAGNGGTIAINNYASGIYTSATGTQSWYSNDVTGCYIGSHWNRGDTESGGTVDGDIAECGIFNRSLSDAETDLLIQTLRNKYGL